MQVIMNVANGRWNIFGDLCGFLRSCGLLLLSIQIVFIDLVNQLLHTS